MLISHQVLQRMACGSIIYKLRMIGIVLASLLCLLPSTVYAQPASPNEDIYVDRANTNGTEDGTSAHPYNTILEGTNAANGGTVWIASGSYAETLTLNRPMTLRSTGGTVTVGKESFHYKIYFPIM